MRLRSEAISAAVGRIRRCARERVLPLLRWRWLCQVACDDGTMAAPAAPWIRRNITICISDWAAPQSTEAATNTKLPSLEMALTPEPHGDQSGRWGGDVVSSSAHCGIGRPRRRYMGEAGGRPTLQSAAGRHSG